MSNMDGHQATRATRNLKLLNRAVTIIAMTVNALSGYRASCIAAGKEDCIDSLVI